MFFPPKRQTIIAMLLAIASTAISTQAMAQNSEFERRSAAMQRARARSVGVADRANPATNAAQPTEVVPVAYAQSAAVATPSPVRRTVNAAQASVPTRQVRPTRRGSQGPARRVAANVQPSPSGSARKPARVAQLIHGGGNPVSGSVIEGEIIGSTYAGGEIIHGGPIQHSGGSSSRGQVYENVIHNDVYTGDVYSDDVYSDDVYIDGDCGCDASIGQQCGSGCCGRGGCPEGPCWLGNLGKAFRTGEYFGGAVGFQSPLFTTPGQDEPADENNLASDSSFGAYGGFNLGIPLCRLSCGVLSGQFGIRSVNTNFNGNEFSSEDRRQIFVTTGVYRRVDQGLQFGVVADILHEEWFTESDLVQIRADIGWVYPAGHTFGFRYATGVQDDETQGSFNGEDFINFFQTTEDNYRFYYRHLAPWGGWGEAFVGWAEASQTIIGVDVDLPVTDRISFQSGFTAFLNDDIVAANSNFQGGNLNESWNLFAGISFKPQGRGWYKSYDRPLFSVADNGTFLIRRQSPEIE